MNVALKLTVKVKPNSKNPGIDKRDPENWVVRVREAPADGKANEAVIRSVAAEIKVPKSCVQILHGKSSRQKILEVRMP